MRSSIFCRAIVFSALVFTTTVLNGQDAGIYPREDIRTFSKDPNKVEELRKAVAELQKGLPNDPTSWMNLAAIHGIPNPVPTDIPASVAALFRQCHKDEAMFFLWHRAYVSAMERLMQDAVKDDKFRIPYWDWYSEPSLPEIFRQEWIDAQHTKKNPLYVANRNAGVNAGNAIWTPHIVTDFDESNFDEFQRTLNSSEHGDIHVSVGKQSNMGSVSTSARDPIFWLHHANIDRLLVVWKKRAGNHVANTSYPEWKSTTYRFPLPGSTASNPTVTTPTIEQLALNSESQAMDYTYENTDPPKVGAPPLPSRPPAAKSVAVEGLRENLMMTEGTHPISARKDIEIAAGGTVTLAVPAPVGNKLLRWAHTQDASQPKIATAVVLSDVNIVNRPDNVVSYRVFLDLPSAGRAGEAFREHFLGTISLFALSHHESHAGDMKTEVRFDATKALTARMKSAEKAPAEINISIVPVLTPGTQAPSTTTLKIGQVRLESFTEPK